MAGFMDFLQLIFQGISTPDLAARKMAEMNITPEELRSQVDTQSQKIAQNMQPQPPQDWEGSYPDVPEGPHPSTWTDRRQDMKSSIGGAMQGLGAGAGSFADQLMQPLGQATGTMPPQAMQPPAPTATAAVAGNMQLPPLAPLPNQPPIGNTPPMANAGEMTGQSIGQLMLPQQAPIPGANPGLPQMPVAGTGGASQVPNPAQVASVGTTPAEPSAAAGRAEVLGGSGEVRKYISDAALKYGQDPNTLMRIAGLESSFNPKAKNPRSSAGGLFQFIDDTASRYGLENKFDPAASSDAGARLLRDNRAYLLDKLGREPTPGELYLAHQQGAEGARKILSQPDVRAADLVGGDAVKLNGGTPDMLARDFAGLWTSKFNNFGGVSGTGKGGSVGTNAPKGNEAGAETGASAAATGTPATAEGKTKSFADRLAELGKSIQVPEGGGGGNNQIPLGSPAPPRPGNFQVDPNTMRTILAMLGPQGSSAGAIPTLAQLMGQR